MRFFFQLNHPAHYHLFKHVISALRASGHDILLAVRDKDILLKLVEGENAINIAPTYRRSGLIPLAWDLIERDRRVYDLARRWKPDLMIGTAVEISHVGKLLGIPSMFVGEDDVRAVWLGALVNNPFCTHILAPEACDNWIWNSKTIFYRGFQKLAYLHPRYFHPDRSRVSSLGESYFLIRASALAAYHDKGRQGLGADTIRRLIHRLGKEGKVYISSEKPLDPDLEAYRLPADVHDIHHVLYHARLFIGDSQSMAMEAAMLGVPNIRMSDFVGRIGVLNEVEQQYRLSVGFLPFETDRMEAIVEELISDPGVRHAWASRRSRMIQEKISVADFFAWLLEEYPESIQVMRRTPEHQLRFRYAWSDNDHSPSAPTEQSLMPPNGVASNFDPVSPQ